MEFVLILLRMRVGVGFMDMCIYIMWVYKLVRKKREGYLKKMRKVMVN